MKKILLSMLLTSASIHAMDNVRIVSFDHETHRQAALNVFKKALPQCSVPYVLGATKTNFQKYNQCDLLITSNKESHNDTVIGLLIYNIRQSTYHEYFSDFFRNSSSTVIITRNALKGLHIDWFCIDPDYQGKGYGKLMLIDHLENRALKDDCDLIDLSPLNQSKNFYTKYNYGPKFLTNDITFSKGLNDDAQAILKEISLLHNV